MTIDDFVLTIFDALSIGAACVVAVNLFAALLIVLRATVYTTRLYRPMLVNIVLSNIPVVLTVVGLAIVFTVQDMVAHETIGSGTAMTVFILVAVLFLAFFPNSAYLITELNFSHRTKDDGVPISFDIIMTLTLAMSGILNTIVSLALVQTFLVIGFSSFPLPSAAPLWSWGVAGGTLLLGCVGMYFGRVMRLNSWDIVMPWRIAIKLVRHLHTHGAVRRMLGFTVTHAVFLGLLYTAVYGPFSLIVFRSLAQLAKT